MENEKEDLARQEEALAMSIGVLVDVLDDLYAQTVKHESMVKANWEEQKPLLEAKVWTTLEQMKILEKEVSDLHQKLEKLEERYQERNEKVHKLLKRVLAKFYLQYNSEKLKSLDAILEHFKFREHDLLVKIQERYGVEVGKSDLEAEGFVDGEDVILRDLRKMRDSLWEEIAHIEEMTIRSRDEVEHVKRELQFPRAEGWRFKHGVDGVYFAMNDFWIESLLATVSLSVLDRCANPRILLSASDSRIHRWDSFCGDGINRTPPSSPVSGDKKPSERGALVSFQLDQCGLIGEKGTKVPSLRPKQLKLLVEFTLTVPVEFNKSMNAWRASKGFRLKILRIEREFKGTLSVPRSLLRMILNRILPGVLKSAIVNAIPVELGHYLSKRYESPDGEYGDGKPEPMHFDLDLNIIGMPGSLSSLNCDLSARSDYGESIRSFLGLSTEQAEVFVKSQKLVQKHFKLKKKKSWTTQAPPWPSETITASDLVAFFTRFSDMSYTTKMAQENSSRRLVPSDEPFRSEWASVMETWQQIVSKVARVDRKQVPNIRELFDRVRALVLKPMQYHVEVRNIRLRGCVDFAMEMVRDFLHRTTREKHMESAKKRVHLTKPIEKELEEITHWYETSLLPILYLKQTVRDVSSVVQGECKSGDFHFSCHQVQFTGPVALSLPFEDNIYPPTHFTIDTSISKVEGSYDIALHLAEHIDPERRVGGPMIKIALKQVHTGIYFDVRHFICSRIIDFKNRELRELLGETFDDSGDGQESLGVSEFSKMSVGPSLSGSSQQRSRKLQRNRSCSEPNLREIGSKVEEGDNASQGQGETDVDCESNIVESIDGNESCDGPEEIAPSKRVLEPETTFDLNTGTFLSRKVSSSVFSNATTITASESEMDEEGAQSSNVIPREAIAEDTRKDGNGVNEGDISKDGSRNDISVVEDEFEFDENQDEDPSEELDEDFLTPKNRSSRLKPTLEEDLLGHKQTFEEIQAKFGKGFMDEHLEGSLDRFVHTFFRELEVQEDKEGFPVLQAFFDQHQDQNDQYLFKVATNPMTTMTARANRVELLGTIENVCHYVRGYVAHVTKLEKTKLQKSAQLSQGAEMDIEASYQPLRLFAYILSKYFAIPEMKVGFTLKATGSVRKELLVGSIVETSRRKTSVQSPDLGKTTSNVMPKSGILVESEISLVELVHDVKCILEGKDPLESDPLEILP